MTTRRIIFIGVPGAGKGTQSQLLAQSLNIPVISTGDIVRSNIKRNTELGKAVKSYSDSGKLVPDEVVLGMVAKAIAKAKLNVGLGLFDDGWILDGFPRNAQQVDSLDSLLLGMEEPPYECVIYLEVSDAVSKERIIERALKAVPPRLDDADQKIVENRLKIYHKETAPLIKIYRERKKLINIDGDRELEEITKELKQTVELIPLEIKNS